MSKTVIFCADGTWNGPEDASGESVLDASDVAEELSESALTNVVKLYANLAGTPSADTIALKGESEKQLVGADGAVRQVAKYLHGVGDSSNILVKLMGGIFGMGVVARIVRGYTFLSRSYAPGDDLVICGFSRGAYTARALAGMIAQIGLLDPATYDPQAKVQAYRLGIAAWARSKSLQLNGKGAMTAAASEIISLIERLLAAPLQTQNLRPEVPIRCVAVWDTVGSLGIPDYVKGARTDLFRFTDTTLSESVQLGFHALALDEQRIDFPVTKWDTRAGVTQSWFIGAHADVGGGYPASESRLSDVAFEWMSANLAGVGLEYVSPSSYVPQEAGFLTQPIHTPWTVPPFDHLGRAARRIDSTDQIDATVKARWNADPTYRPAPLTAIWT